MSILLSKHVNEPCSPASATTCTDIDIFIEAFIHLKQHKLEQQNEESALTSFIFVLVCSKHTFFSFAHSIQLSVLFFFLSRNITISRAWIFSWSTTSAPRSGSRYPTMGSSAISSACIFLPYEYIKCNSFELLLAFAAGCWLTLTLSMLRNTRKLKSTPRAACTQRAMA